MASVRFRRVKFVITLYNGKGDLFFSHILLGYSTFCIQQVEVIEEGVRRTHYTGARTFEGPGVRTNNYFNIIYHKHVSKLVVI